MSATFTERFYARDTDPIKYNITPRSRDDFGDWMARRIAQVVDITRVISPVATEGLTDQEVHFFWLRRLETDRESANRRNTGKGRF